ncbi:hypothetical protein Cgig2_020654 [Carnegiea gigantea]|uniref:Endonuclease/exonuclease/phosphatase domain-containing protein n=1 Tax=Carnegiea gigantea TaxID=171969 RepID=A0A9Q1KIZ6_9CARY|nr:hypothetical protein Cgig2_020654 [Carnegiea gigantea]
MEMSTPPVGNGVSRPYSPVRQRTHSHSGDPPGQLVSRQNRESQQKVTVANPGQERMPGTVTSNQLSERVETLRTIVRRGSLGSLNENNMNHLMMQNVEEERGVESGDNSVKILVWNVWGAGSNKFLNSIKEHIRMHKPQIIALLETHVSGPAVDEVCRNIGYQGIFWVEACGHQGGIWLLWDKEKIDLILINSHTQFVTMELSHLAYRTNQPWMLAGDFNETKSLEERDHGGCEMDRRCQNFNNWIENNELIDLGFTGLRFTWSRGNSNYTRKNARLD